MKYRVIKFFSKRSENLKKYNVGDSIDLSKNEAAPLIDQGFLEKPKPAAKSKKKSNESTSKKDV